MRDLWHSFRALDPRSGTSVEYGTQQVEAVLRDLGQRVAEFVARP